MGRRMKAGVLLCVAALQMISGQQEAGAAAPAARAVAAEPSIASLQSQYAAGDMNVRAVVTHYLARIHDIDATGPALHSIIETNPDALSIAATLDKTPAAARGAHARGPTSAAPKHLAQQASTVR